MNRVVHFELQVADPDKAAAFYKDVFGWQVSKWDGPEEYFLVRTGEGEAGIDGGIMRSPDGVSRTTNTIKVDSVDDFLNKVTDSGGIVVVPKMAIPGVGYLAYCKDPVDGLFGIMHDDPEAK
ncbi:VOC family protein [Fictibacillus nanhaiensis]|nr:VOC family protein [Fictibacillus nanhaiensis]